MDGTVGGGVNGACDGVVEAVGMRGIMEQNIIFCPLIKERCRQDCMLLMPSGECAIRAVATYFEEHAVTAD